MQLLAPISKLHTVRESSTVLARSFLLASSIPIQYVRLQALLPVKLFVNMSSNRPACTATPQHWKVGCSIFQRLYSYAHTRHSGQEHELLDWLAKVTFPTEARFEDVAFARKSYTSSRIIQFWIVNQTGIQAMVSGSACRRPRLMNWVRHSLRSELMECI